MRSDSGCMCRPLTPTALSVSQPASTMADVTATDAKNNRKTGWLCTRISPHPKGFPKPCPGHDHRRWRDSRKRNTPRLRKEKGKVRNSPQQSDYLGNEDLVAGSHEDLVAVSHYCPNGSGLMANVVIFY